jgi:hypothetical protein
MINDEALVVVNHEKRHQAERGEQQMFGSEVPASGGLNRRIGRHAIPLLFMFVGTSIKAGPVV